MILSSGRKLKCSLVLSFLSDASRFLNLLDASWSQSSRAPQGVRSLGFPSRRIFGICPVTSDKVKSNHRCLRCTVRISLEPLKGAPFCSKMFQDKGGKESVNPGSSSPCLRMARHTSRFLHNDDLITGCRTQGFRLLAVLHPWPRRAFDRRPKLKRGAMNNHSQMVIIYVIILFIAAFDNGSSMTQQFCPN